MLRDLATEDGKRNEGRAVDELEGALGAEILERLKDTGNPQALQDQLGHATAKMTLRYMKTLTAEESVRINQQVDFRW